MLKTGWIAHFQDQKVIEQYPESGEDNTLKLGEEILPNQDELLQFTIVTPEGNRIGIDLDQRFFIVGDEGFLFHSQHEKLKLVYFITRQVTMNQELDEGVEHEKIFTVGYEDADGKLFLNMFESGDRFFFSITNP